METQWSGHSLKTYGEVSDMMKTIYDSGDQVKADDFMKFMHKQGEHADSNIGYLTGYFNPETSLGMRKMFGVRHPIFGNAIPTPETANGDKKLMGGYLRGIQEQGQKLQAQPVPADIDEVLIQKIFNKMVVDFSEQHADWVEQNIPKGAGINGAMGFCLGAGASLGIFCRVLAKRNDLTHGQLREAIITQLDKQLYMLREVKQDGTES